MKYETPELTALTPAINAIQTFQSNGVKAGAVIPRDNRSGMNEHLAGYADWE